MPTIKFSLFFIILLLTTSLHASQAIQDQVQLEVWANEAIVATYTYGYKNYLAQQKAIAKYFTGAGWISYSKTLNDSKLPEAVQKNSYEVSSVATLPPVVKILSPGIWEATMPLLVIYKNPQYQQKQNLQIVLQFQRAMPGQGVRGFAITSLQAKISAPPCRCQPKAEDELTENAQK